MTATGSIAIEINLLCVKDPASCRSSQDYASNRLGNMNISSDCNARCLRPANSVCALPAGKQLFVKVYDELVKV